MQAPFEFDPDCRTLDDFVAEYYDHGSIDAEGLQWPTENLNAQQFSLNVIPSDHSVADEVRGPFMNAFRLLARIPLMPELQEPVLTRALQSWSKHVLDGAIDQSWSGGWTRHEMLRFYRQISPAEYQTPSHMKVVYTVIAAFDLITTYNCFVDDAVDGDEIREEGPAWYIHHPKTFPADAGLVMSVGNRLLHHFLPGSHPCKSDLIHLYHNYMVYCTSYLSVTHARNQKSPNTSLKEATQPSIDDLTGGTFAAFHYMRSGNYVQLILHACRLAACYKNILSTSDRRYLYTDTIRRAAVVLQIVEDIRDSRIMDVQVPRRLPLNEYLQSINDDMIKDFIAGELNHAFLIASLELARGGTGVMSLTGDEKEEIMKTLRECYLADEGHLEDIESQKRRLYRLCAMFLKYDIYGYIKKHVLPSTLIQYFLVHGQASREFNMPKDLLSHAVVSMVRQDSCSRSTHVAEELEKVMTTPNEAIDEMEKVLRIFELLQNI